MGYLKIPNLYKCQDILLFKECYALEKVHGTSAHVGWRDGEKLHFFSGGERQDKFEALFDKAELEGAFRSTGLLNATVYGEAYGGKQQGMKATYGEKLCFIVFDIKIGDTWLSVPDMAQLAGELGFEVVPYEIVSTYLKELDLARDRASSVAYRRGCGDDKVSEGVVLRPLIEVTKSNGQRVIAKHKSEAFNERSTKQKVMDPDKLKILTEADEIATEWVTHNRLMNVLSHMEPDIDMKATGDVIRTMVADVILEAGEEIVDTKEARRAIGSRSAKLFKQYIQNKLRETP